jgi:hypothetical protein
VVVHEEGMFGLIDYALRNLSTSELHSAVTEDLAGLLDSVDATRSEADSGTPANNSRWTPAAGVADVLDGAALALGAGDQNSVAQRLIPTAEARAAAIHAERLRQARLSFNSALVLSVSGVLILLASLGLLLNDLTTQGVVTVVVGSVCEVVAVLAFRLNKEANDRLDAINRDLALLAKTRLISDLINAIPDEKARSRAIVSAIRNLSADQQGTST